MPISWVEAAERTARISLAVFGEPIEIAHNDGSARIATVGVVRLKDTENKIGTLRTDFETPYIEFIPPEGYQLKKGDIVYYRGLSFTVADYSDDDIADGLTRLKLRQNKQ